MSKSIGALKTELAKIRTGRAHPSLLEHITVDYYGSEVPLNQAANVNAEDSRTLSVVPFDKSMVGKIEKAIMTSDLGLNPATSGNNIRVPLPALTEERRPNWSRLSIPKASRPRSPFATSAAMPIPSSRISSRKRN
jgi:ribosome recycling factor